MCWGRSRTGTWVPRAGCSSSRTRTARRRATRTSIRWATCGCKRSTTGSQICAASKFDPSTLLGVALSLSKDDYAYDTVGNILTWQQQADSDAPTVWQYGFDRADQLTAAVHQTT